MHSGEPSATLNMARLGFMVAVPVLLSLACARSSGAQALSEDEWISVPAQSLAVDPGSPLDFSTLVPAAAAGSTGPLALVNGGLAFARAGRSTRFNCGMLANGPNGTWDFPTHSEADALAEQFRLHGYDLVRFHYLDARLMRHAKHDFEVDAGDLDRFHYLLAALKKRGIYWILDVQTAYDSGVAGGLNKKLGPDSLKIRLNFDPAVRAHWVKLLDTLYSVPNPYTGATPLADPALAFVVGANENSLAFGSLSDPGRFPSGLALVFDRWVRHRFASPDRLAAALPDLGAAERAGAPIALPASWNATGPRLSLFLRFVADQEVDTYRWMQARLAERGFHGPLLGYPEWYRHATGETRARLPITDIHAYLGEVTSYAPGTPVKLPSSTSDEGLGNWTTNAGARWLDRPLVATEYGIPIPNPYRYEGGVAFPALAAFQGYSALCRMANMTVEPAILPPGPNVKGLLGYSVGIDPTSRAAETLTTLLFYRGDVRPATATVAVPFGEREFGQPDAAFLPGAVRRAALLARFGLVEPQRAATIGAPVRIVPLAPKAGGEGNKLMDWVTDMITGRSDAQLARLVADLRANGTLRPGNLTDPAAKVFQSQTGEITFDQATGRIMVVTPKTEALSTTTAAASGPVTLSHLSIRSLNAGALLAASALDGRSLADSRRILLILAGDSTNTGMRISGVGTNRRLEDWGTLPILMRRVMATVSLATAFRHTARFSVLSLRGQRVLQRTISVGVNGQILLSLDTKAVPDSPATFFLLEAVDGRVGPS